MSSLLAVIVIPMLARTASTDVLVCRDSPRMEDFESDCAKTGDDYMCETFFVIYSIAAFVLFSMLVVLCLIR